jgi:hypothetical protein
MNLAGKPTARPPDLLTEVPPIFSIFSPIFQRNPCGHYLLLGR